MQLSNVCRVFLSVLFLANPVILLAQATPGYTTNNVSNILTLDVPDNWLSRDAKSRQTITNISERALDGLISEKQHVASISVRSSDVNPHGIIRVSIIPTERFSQHEFAVELYNDKSGFREELEKYFIEDFALLSEAYKKIGLQLLTQPEVYFLSLDNYNIFAVSYSRSSLIADSPMTVTQFHIPNGENKILVSMTFRNSEEKNIRPILEHALWSIKFL